MRCIETNPGGMPWEEPGKFNKNMRCIETLIDGPQKGIQKSLIRT